MHASIVNLPAIVLSLATGKQIWLFSTMMIIIEEICFVLMFLVFECTVKPCYNTVIDLGPSNIITVTTIKSGVALNQDSVNWIPLKNSGSNVVIVLYPNLC